MIKEVISINQQGTKSMCVGIDGVVRIEDNSIEHTDNTIFQFHAYDKDDILLHTFISGALSIEYFKE